MLALESVTVADLKIAMRDILPANFFDEDDEVLERLKIEATYAMALEQQSEDIEQLKKEQSLKFPSNFNFSE